MNFLTGKHLSRRHLLRGLGATVALPSLGIAAEGRLIVTGGRCQRRSSLCSED